MEQEITTSKSIINYFYDGILESRQNPLLQVSEFQHCFEKLRKNRLVMDKANYHKDQLLSEIVSLPDTREADIIRRSFVGLMTDHSIFIECGNIKKDNYEIDICSFSNDKIYFDPSLNEDKKDILKLICLSRRIDGIELHDEKSFLNPTRIHRLLQERKDINIIKLEKDKVIKIEEYLKPYLRIAKNVQFIDKFLPNPLSVIHLQKLLDLCVSANKITIITSSEEDFINSKKPETRDIAKKDYTSFSDIIKNYKKIKLEDIKSKGHLERFIITENYEIQLPGGLDQIGVDGYPRIDSEHKKLKIIIEKIQ